MTFEQAKSYIPAATVVELGIDTDEKFQNYIDTHPNMFPDINLTRPYKRNIYYKLIKLLETNNVIFLLGPP